MQPNLEIRPEMPENAGEFTDEFFTRFQLRHARQPLQLNAQVAKNYRFPTLYKDVGCAMAIFLCDYEKARKALPHPALRPVRATRGRAFVAFSCYEYRKVLGVNPYNEIAMTIPVMAGPGFAPPVLPAAAPALFSKTGYYVFGMPVTSKENQIRGNRIWGLPKVTERIDIETQGEDCVTTSYEADGGAPYFKLRVPMAGKPKSFDVKANLYSFLEGKPLQSATCFKATFAMNQFPKLLFRKGVKPDREYLWIGDGPSGAILRSLDIEPHPFQLRYVKSMNAAFDLPNEGFSL